MDYKLEDDLGNEEDQHQYDEPHDNVEGEDSKQVLKENMLMGTDDVVDEISALIKDIEDLDLDLSNTIENYKNVKGNRAVQVEVERAVNNALANNIFESSNRWTSEAYQVREEKRYSPNKDSPLIERSTEPQYKEQDHYIKSYTKKWEQPEPSNKEEWSYERSMEKFLRANPTSAAGSHRGEYTTSTYSQRSRGTEGHKPVLRGSVGVDIPTKPYHYKGVY